MIRAAALILLAVAQAGDGGALAGRTPGAPAECIELDRVDGPDIVDAGTILYRQSGARIWAAHPVERCQALRPFAHLVVRNTGRRLCDGDRFLVLPPGSAIPSEECRFGAFTPYDKPPR